MVVATIDMGVKVVVLRVDAAVFVLYFKARCHLFVIHCKWCRLAEMKKKQN